MAHEQSAAERGKSQELNLPWEETFSSRVSNLRHYMLKHHVKTLQPDCDFFTVIIVLYPESVKVNIFLLIKLL